MPPKPKLTPEEKKELRAQKKIEKKLKQIERKKQIKRDLLDREQKYGAVTLGVQEQNWRKMLIAVSLPEIQKDLEFAWHNFERVIDCKDFTISLLLDELEKANKQYFMNLKAHTENIDKFIIEFEKSMYRLHEEYLSEVKDLDEEHQKLVEETKTSTSEEENYLKTILHILKIEMKDVKRTRHAEYFSKLEEQDSKQHQLVQRMKGILEQVHYQVWTETVDFLEDYKNKIKERKKDHNELKAQDDRLQKLIQNQLESIRHAYSTIRSLKIKKTEQEKFLGRKLGDLQSEFDFFTMAFDTLKTKLAADRRVDFEKLNCLTLNFNDVITYLENLQTKGKHILHVAGVCRKLETLEEKILPFPVNFLNEMSKPCVDDVEEYIEVLELFWQRVGKADAMRYAVNEEREFLITENEILKRRLHHYCQCLKCPDYQPFKNRVKLCIHVTEGTTEMKKYNKHPVLCAQFTQEPSIKTESLSLISWNDADLPLKLNEEKLSDQKLNEQT